MNRLNEIQIEIDKIKVQKGDAEFMFSLKYEKLSNERSTLQAIDEMQDLPKGTILYFASKKFSSTSTGNHESFDVYYIRNNTLVKVWMPILMKKQKGYDTSKYLWHCDGGNYSFTQDIADRISYQVYDESGGFRDERI